MKTNKDIFPNSTMISFTNGFVDNEENYFEGYKTLPDSKLQGNSVSLECNGIDIPYNGKLLRITVSEWGLVQLVDKPNYVDHLDKLRSK